ncbi:MAG: diguanylate cyclase response regulator [Deltaproteobacteria bacterium RIFOXYD12_FULL_50_9]|nr:MAG: diguanylate cyclase response regulator [Deltaproteobacteria bacterium RIFOXYD12_FULL_50_9]
MEPQGSTIENSRIADLQAYRITVLLVDDQPMISEAVRRALQDEKDIDFHYCQNPTKAIRMALDIRPTVILQDLVMPELDGLMMVRFFRTNPDTALIPIIVLSVKEEATIKSEAFAAGANDYLVKLPDKMELMARIRYHSRAYINQKQRDEAFQALKESQERLAAANRELEKLSSLDGLTGISNRRRFDEALLQEWRRAMRSGSIMSVIILDIDFFKLYNDNYGHQGGDDCLKKVARTLEGCLRRVSDMVARYGGEEFVAILPEIDAAGAMSLAESMRAGIQEQRIPHAKSKVSEYVSISVGVASAIPQADAAPESLVAAADLALYKAKEEGRNRVMLSSLG